MMSRRLLRKRRLGQLLYLDGCQLAISNLASAEVVDATHLAPEEQFDPSSFVKYTRVIGRAYQCQAVEFGDVKPALLVGFTRTPTRCAFVKVAIFLASISSTVDDDRILSAADAALRLAIEAGKKLTIRRPTHSARLRRCCFCMRGLSTQSHCITFSSEIHFQ